MLLPHAPASRNGAPCDIGVNRSRGHTEPCAAPPRRPRRRPRRGRGRRRRPRSSRPGHARAGVDAVEVVPAARDGALRRRRRPRRARRAAAVVVADRRSPERRPGRDPGDVRRRRPGVRRGARGGPTSTASSPGTAEIEYVAAFCGFAPGFSYLAGLPARAAPYPGSSRRGQRCRPGRSASPGPGAASTRRRRRAAGGCSAAPTRRCGTRPATGPALLRARDPGEVRGRMTLACARRRRPDHRAGPGPDRAGPPRASRGPVRSTRPAADAGQPAGRQRARRRRARGAARRARCCAPTAACWVAVTGAGRHVEHGRAAEWLPAGATLRVETPATGRADATSRSPAGSTSTRCSGSRSTDTLAWVGPPRVEAGAVLPVGAADARAAAASTRPRPPGRGPLRITPGPRADWFDDDALDRLLRDAVRRGGRLQPGRAAPRRAAAAAACATGELRQRGDGARRGAGAAERAARRVPGRPPADRRLPGDRRRRRRRPVAVRPAAAGRAELRFVRGA